MRTLVACGRIRKIDGHAVWEGVRYLIGDEGIQIIATAHRGRVSSVGKK